jgi:leucyl aminopeptidase (aminopeptidase T)
MIEHADMIENAIKPFELNADPDDTVLIVTDTQMEPEVWTVLNNAARAAGIKPAVALIPPTNQTQGSPPPQVEEAILASDLCVMATSNAMVHSDVGVKAQHDGVKLLAMEEVTADMLRGPAASADYGAMQDLAVSLQEKVNDGERIRVSSPGGLDLEAGIKNRSGFGVAGKVERHPGLDHFLIAAFPDGEVSISPVEGTSNGKVVWDVSMHEIGLLEKPIHATVEDGYATDIEGGIEAEQLRDILEATGDPEVYNIAEIALGINPSAEIVGTMRQDKKKFGYAHIALGANNDTGGTVEAPLHLDGVIKDVTYEIDGEVLCENGEIKTEKL